MFLNRSLPTAVLLTLLALGACKKEEVYPELILPGATQAGANTAGAKIDGKVWVPETSLFVGSPISASYQKEGSRYTLRLGFSRVPATETAPFNETSIRFLVPDVRATGRIELNRVAQPTTPSISAPYGTFKYAKPFPGREFITGPDASGYLTITRLDTVARIVAGTFEFQARETNGGATITVSEGRFDVTF
jgi:hypothetical protein